MSDRTSARLASEFCGGAERLARMADFPPDPQTFLLFCWASHSDQRLVLDAIRPAKPGVGTPSTL